MNVACKTGISIKTHVSCDENEKAWVIVGHYE